MTEIQLLLLGAGIGLVSSLLTTIVTTVINHYTTKAKEKREKESHLYRLLGTGVALSEKNMDDAREELLGLSEMWKQSQREKSTVELDLSIGLWGTLISEPERLAQYRRSAEEREKYETVVDP
jgi:hypothetical protein